MDLGIIAGVIGGLVFVVVTALIQARLRKRAKAPKKSPPEPDPPDCDIFHNATLLAAGSDYEVFVGRRLFEVSFEARLRAGDVIQVHHDNGVRRVLTLSGDVPARQLIDFAAVTPEPERRGQPEQIAALLRQLHDKLDEQKAKQEKPEPEEPARTRFERLLDEDPF